MYSGSEVEVGQRDRQMQRAWVGRKYMILGELRGTRQPESKKARRTVVRLRPG